MGYSKYDYRNKGTDNSRNRHSGKRLRTSFGDAEMSVPRDRKGEFEPQVLKKGQTSVSQDIEEKDPFHVRQRHDHRRYREPYPGYLRYRGVGYDRQTCHRQILPIAKEWQQRPLEPIYAVFPKTEIQNCIIHQLRNSSKYVSYKDLR